VSTRPGFFEAEVLRRERLSAHLVRIVLGGPGLTGFVSTGIPDEWVALVVPGQFQSRYYTVRWFTGGELTLDVVVHDRGLVTEWAQRDCVGDRVSVSEPKGSFELPAAATWVVLVGDLTGLPAIARIREEVSLPVLSWVESGDGPIEGYCPETSWLPTPGEGSGLAEFVAGLDWPEGEGYFWMAGESAQMRDIRRFVRHELGWGIHQHDLMGYWSNARGRRTRAVDPAPIYARGRAAGKSDEEIWMDYDMARTEPESGQ
jgi:NADPH-dependent ferric siderophore reductase